MTYAALPDMRIPYDNDGTVAGEWDAFHGMTAWYTGTQLAELNDSDLVATAPGPNTGYNGYPSGALFWFPEEREVTAIYATRNDDRYAFTGMRGSNDTTNGLDGTWETATLPSGVPETYPSTAFNWRVGIKAVSFTGAKKTVSVHWTAGQYGLEGSTYMIHLYGEKAAGQTPDDIVFLDGDTSYAEYAAPEDFGDRPLGTTVVRTYKVKNTSATLTANTINIQCNDNDFAISDDNATWVVTLNISSLAPGASSSVLYIRDTTPAIGNLLGPRAARIVVTVGSWT